MKQEVSKQQLVVSQRPMDLTITPGSISITVPNKEESKCLIREDERLKDPLNDRVMPVSEVPLPPAKELDLYRVFKDDETTIPNYKMVE